MDKPIEIDLTRLVNAVERFKEALLRWGVSISEIAHAIPGFQRALKKRHGREKYERRYARRGGKHA